jgi:hypothetical protein
MQQLKTISIGAVAAQQTGTFSFQWDTPFPDAEYATGISLASNDAMAGDPQKGLHIVSVSRRTDGLDLTLSNPQNVDQPTDIIQVWAGY